MPNLTIVQQIAEELKIKDFQVANTVTLIFEEDCTIPFVARYRKEKTGSLDEVQLRDVRDRYQYLDELEQTKRKYFKVVEELAASRADVKAKLPELKAKFMGCKTKQELEDLYLPYKPKRRTRAQIAREKGLEPLLDLILNGRREVNDLVALAAPFVTAKDATIDATLRVEDASAALSGAADIMAERVAETPEVRAMVREISNQTGMLLAEKVEKPTAAGAAADSDGDGEAAPAGKKDGKGKKDRTAVYENYYNYRESIQAAPSHRVMAVRRGEAEKVLRVQIEVDAARIVNAMREKVLGQEPSTDAVKQWLSQVVEDAYKRLLSPSIETEIRLDIRQRAEQEAIRVFSKNLENLLLLPPIPDKTVLGVDPGLRTGSKLAVVSSTGRYLDHAIIYPHPENLQHAKNEEAKKEILRLIDAHKPEYIAIGNGTGSREIDRFIRHVMKESGREKIKRCIVSEAGASVYSTDAIAREEFPDLDPTVRSAVSIARRLQDPLAELVKIDPRSIGVGQYQHDVNVTRLKSSLEEVVESCVNRVGVNVNTASFKLLSYVSGIGPALAKSLVQFRDEKGSFTSRAALPSVVGFGPKAFEQAAGFLRVPNGENPLDNSAVHPERYEIVQKMAQDQGRPIEEFIGNAQLVNGIPLENYVTATVGVPTLRDIAAELIKPGRDPREDGTRLHYSDDVTEIEDLKIGMVLKGTITNVTNFGAFVDIGVHQEGLVHISELSDQFVKDPASVASVGDVVDVRVIDVDVARRRISLSCRTPGSKPAAASEPRPQGQRGPQGQGDQPRRDGGGHPGQRGSNDRHQQRPQAAAGSGRGPQKGGHGQHGGGQRGGGGGGGGGRAPQPQYTLEDLMKKFNAGLKN